MGRLNTVAEYWPACCHCHGSHTAPGVGEDTKRTTSVDHLSDYSEQEMEQSASVGMQRDWG